MKGEGNEHKKWKIWKNWVPKILTNSDCDNDVDGVCDKNLTLHQCIEKAPTDIDYGLFLKLKNGKTICDHVNTSMYIPRQINFNYNLVEKDRWDELRNTETWTFVNTERNPFPEWDGKELHYLDKVILTVNPPLALPVFDDAFYIIPYTIFPTEEVPNVRVLNGDKVYLVNKKNELLVEQGGEFIWKHQNPDDTNPMGIHYKPGADMVTLSFGSKWLGVKGGRVVLSDTPTPFRITMSNEKVWDEKGMEFTVGTVPENVKTSRSRMVYRGDTEPSSVPYRLIIALFLIVVLVFCLYHFSS